MLRRIVPGIDQESLVIGVLDKHNPDDGLRELLAPAVDGEDIGLMSDAGCPAVADPGALVVRLAHELGIPVVPLAGPSSILLALMASGLNGQSFCFHGYLPVERDKCRAAIRKLERESKAHGQTQIFMETPYRNERLLEMLLENCMAGTRLCLACDLTMDSELVRTRTIAEWHEHPPAPGKRPCVFLLAS